MYLNSFDLTFFFSDNNEMDLFNYFFICMIMYILVISKFVLFIIFPERNLLYI